MNPKDSNDTTCIIQNNQDDTTTKPSQSFQTSCTLSKGLNAHSTKALPMDYVLTDDDVLCGRGSRCFNHVGNQRFRKLVEANLERYNSTICKFDKTAIICEIITTIRTNSPNGGFLKTDPQSGQYFEVGDFLAREKTSQAFRDASQDRYKSSNATKKKKRLMEQQQQQLAMNNSSSTLNQSVPSNLLIDMTNHSFVSPNSVMAFMMGGQPNNNNMFPQHNNFCDANSAVGNTSFSSFRGNDSFNNSITLDQPPQYQGSYNNASFYSSSSSSEFGNASYSSYQSDSMFQQPNHPEAASISGSSTVSGTSTPMGQNLFLQNKHMNQMNTLSNNIQQLLSLNNNNNHNSNSLNGGSNHSSGSSSSRNHFNATLNGNHTMQQPTVATSADPLCMRGSYHEPSMNTTLFQRDNSDTDDILLWGIQSCPTLNVSAPVDTTQDQSMDYIDSLMESDELDTTTAARNHQYARDETETEEDDGYLTNQSMKRSESMKESPSPTMTMMEWGTKSCPDIKFGSSDSINTMNTTNFHNEKFRLTDTTDSTDEFDNMMMMISSPIKSPTKSSRFIACGRPNSLLARLRNNNNNNNNNQTATTITKSQNDNNLLATSQHRMNGTSYVPTNERIGATNMLQQFQDEESRLLNGTRRNSLASIDIVGNLSSNFGYKNEYIMDKVSDPLEAYFNKDDWDIIDSPSLFNSPNSKIMKSSSSSSPSYIGVCCNRSNQMIHYDGTIKDEERDETVFSSSTKTTTTNGPKTDYEPYRNKTETVDGSTKTIPKLPFLNIQ